MVETLKLATAKKLESTHAKDTFAEYLERAKGGEISAIGVVLILEDGKICSDYSVDKFIHLDTLVGALEHLKYRILKDTEHK